MEQRRMGRYLLGPTIGSGGFSKVKLGLDETTNEKVALKLLKKDKLSMNSTTKQQVEREIIAMSKIQHENVIRLRDVQWDANYTKKNGKTYEVILTVLELATGGELFEVLAFTGCFEESIARTYFHQLIHATAYCHANGIAHRDLKPENLLLDNKFTLKLADFGFAKVFHPNDRTMYTECGTPGYMAPELFRRTGYDAVQADIWSCGVILFIMLAGFPPFQKPALNDWWFNKLANNKHHLFWEAHSRTPNVYFSESFKDLINKILAVDHTKRMTMADIIKHPWFMGPTISHGALYTEMVRRKTTVDENKNRERLAKQKEKEQGGTLNEWGNDIAMDRGDDSISNNNTDELPNSTPSLSLDTFDATSTLDAVVDQMNSLNSEWSNHSLESSSPFTTIEDSTSSSSTTTSTTTPPPTFDETFPHSYTRFESTSTPTIILQRLQRNLEQQKFQYALKEKAYKLKASSLTATGHLEFTIQIYVKSSNDSTSSPVYVVDFHRRTGESQTFRDLYTLMRYNLKDIALNNTITTENTPVTTTAVTAPAS